MKNCIHCGTAAPDEAEKCPACHHAFSYVGSATAAPAPTPAAPAIRERPDGSILIGLGWGGIAFGVLLFLIALVQSSGRYNRDLGDIMMGTMMGAMAGGLFHLGLLLLLVGLVIRAIWFIPGPERKAKDGTAPPHSP